MFGMPKMDIIVWSGLIVDFTLIKDLIGKEPVRRANQDELKRYYERPDRSNLNRDELGRW
jgi:hypothetical protein